MHSFQIITDSSCDTPASIIQQNNIEVIPFYVSFDSEHYYKEIVEMPIKEFYNRLQSEKVFPKTSLPSVEDYMNVFRKYLDEGKDIMCFCITDKFSGSFQSATNAKLILEEEYPNANIYLVNSILATSVQGLLVLEAAKMQQAGYSLEETFNKVEEIKHTARIMFTVGTLEYLQKGGRIGKASALAGNILNLKPLIQLRDTELQPYGTVRGRKKSIAKIIDMTKEHFQEIGAQYEDYSFCITTGTCYEEAEEVKQTLINELNINVDNPIFTVGVTIGTYTGPDPVGICFIKKYNA